MRGEGQSAAAAEREARHEETDDGQTAFYEIFGTTCARRRRPKMARLASSACNFPAF